MINRIIVIIALVLLTQSCEYTVVSLHPLYTGETLVENNDIIGTWENDADDTIWEVYKPDKLSYTPIEYKDHNRDNNRFTYLVKIYLEEEPDDYTMLMVHLVSLGGNLYGDLFPRDQDDLPVYLSGNLLPVHSFVKVNMDSVVSVGLIDKDLFETILEESDYDIEYFNERDNKLLLMSEPGELQEILMRFEEIDSKLFENSTWELSPYVIRK